MKKTIIFGLVFLLMLSLVSATTFDDFNRVNSITIGNGWTEVEDGSNEFNILNNQLRISDVDNLNDMYLNKSYEGVIPTQLDFKIYIDSGSRLKIYDRDISNNFKIYVYYIGGDLVYRTLSGNHLIMPLSEDTWYDVSLRNINYTNNVNGTYSIYIDNVLKDTSVPMYGAGNTPKYLEIGTGASVITALVDDIILNEGTSSNFSVTANDIYDNSIINNFSIEVDGYKNFSTTTGTIVTDINTSLTYNITIWNITNYFNKTYMNWETNKTLNANITPYTLIQAFSSSSNSSIYNFNIIATSLNSTANLSINTTNKFVYIPLFNATYNVSITNAINGTTSFSEDNITVKASPYFKSINFSLYPAYAIVISIFDEETLERITESVSLNILNINASNATNITITGEYNKSFMPGAYRFYFDSATYLPNNYFFFLSTVDIDPQNITLYMLPNNASSAELRLNVKSQETLKSFKNIITRLQRLYLSDAVWRTVQTDQSGEFGETYFDVKELNTDYRFAFLNTDGALLSTTQGSKFSCDAGICELTTLVTETADTTVVADLIYSYNFINNTENATLNWTDTNAEINTVRIKIEKFVSDGFITLSDTTQVGSSGTVTFNKTGLTGGVRVSVKASSAELEESFLAQLGEFSLAKLLGKSEGTFWSFGVMTTTAMMGLFSPMGAIVMTIFGLILTFFLGFSTPINVTFIILASIIGISIGIKIRR